MSTVCKISSENLENNSVYNDHNQNRVITQRDKYHIFCCRQGPSLYLISKVRDRTARDKAKLSGVRRIEICFLLSPLQTFIIFIQDAQGDRECSVG